MFIVLMSWTGQSLMMSPVHTATPGVNGDVPHGPDHTPGLVSVSHQHPRLHLLAGEVV